MPRTPARRLTPAVVISFLILQASACTDPSASPTGPSATADELVLASTGDLVLPFPALVAGDLRTARKGDDQDRYEAEANGPALIQGDDRFDYVGERPTQQIFNPQTMAGFRDDYAWAVGWHQYIGNVGRLETDILVTHDDRLIGSDSDETRNFTPFLLDFGRVKDVDTYVRVWFDETCGASVRGNSVHEASWEFFLGTGVATWGLSRERSRTAPVRQPACRETGGYPANDVSPAGIVCHYWVTYDLNTLEVINSTLLYCQKVGAGAQM